MKKLAILLTITIVVLLINCSFVFAETAETSVEEVKEVKVYDKEALKRAEEKADYGERFASAIIVSFPNYLIDVIGIQDPTTLIFNHPPYYKLDKVNNELRNLNQDDENKKIKLEQEKERIENEIKIIENNEYYLHTFTESEFKAVAKVYSVVENFIPYPLVMAIVMLGYLSLASTFRGEDRSAFKLYFEGILIGVMLLRFAPEIWKMIFGANAIAIEMIKSSVADKMGRLSFQEILYNPETKSLGNAIVGLIVATSIGVLNWQYTLRNLILGFLIIVFPIMSVAIIVPDKRSSLTIWLRELIANVFLQSAHALAFAFFINFIYSAETTNRAFWTSIVFVTSINTIATLVRRILGCESVGSGIIGGVGSALGIASLFSIGRIATIGLMRKENRDRVKNNNSTEKTKVTEQASSVLSNISEENSLPSLNPVKFQRTREFARSAQRGISKHATPFVASFAKTGVRGILTGAGMMAGAMIGGAATGNAQTGAAAGGSLGYFATTKIPNINLNCLDKNRKILENAGYDTSNLSSKDREIYANAYKDYTQIHTDELEKAKEGLTGISPRVEIAKNEYTIARAGNNQEMIEEKRNNLNQLKAQESTMKIREIQAKDALEHRNVNDYLLSLGKNRKPPTGGGII